jgi:hypothetical protein
LKTINFFEKLKGKCFKYGEFITGSFFANFCFLNRVVLDWDWFGGLLAEGFQ